MPRLLCAACLMSWSIVSLTGCGPGAAPQATGGSAAESATADATTTPAQSPGSATAAGTDDPTAAPPESTDARSATRASSSPDEPPANVAPAEEPRWTSLFDGKSLEGWELSNFGGEGAVTVEDGAVLMEMGADLTGIHTRRPLPRLNFEVVLDAKRVDGGDFFCGLTFPVREEHCSLIVGGWGGGVCGLSSIDSYDASENDTTTYRTFESGKWYRIRLRVTAPRIQAWIDDEQIVDQPIEGKRLSIRQEVEPSLPFGIASWRTTAALRDIRIRELSAAEIERDAAEVRDAP